MQLAPGHLYEINQPNGAIAERKFFIVKDGRAHQVVGHEVIHGLYGSRTEHEVGDYVRLKITGQAGVGEIRSDKYGWKYEILSVLQHTKKDSDFKSIVIDSDCVGIQILDTQAQDPVWPIPITVISKGPYVRQS